MRVYPPGEGIVFGASDVVLVYRRDPRKPRPSAHRRTCAPIRNEAGQVVAVAKWRKPYRVAL